MAKWASGRKELPRSFATPSDISRYPCKKRFLGSAQRLVIGTGMGVLPVMMEVKGDAERHGIELVALPTVESRRHQRHPHMTFLTEMWAHPNRKPPNEVAEGHFRSGLQRLVAARSQGTDQRTAPARDEAILRRILCLPGVQASLLERLTSSSFQSAFAARKQ